MNLLTVLLKAHNKIMCVCFFFSRFVWTNGYVPQKPDGESMFSIIFPIKRYCIPTISTILRMPNSCERINQRMPNFQKATEVSASDDELKVPFWEWVYSFKDLNMHVYIYIYILSSLLFFFIVIYYFQPMNIHMGWVQATSKFSQEVRTCPVRSELSGSDK